MRRAVSLAGAVLIGLVGQAAAQCAPHSFIDRKGLGIGINSEFAAAYGCTCGNAPFDDHPPVPLSGELDVCWAASGVGCDVPANVCRTSVTEPAFAVTCVPPVDGDCPEDTTHCPADGELTYTNAEDNGQCDVCFPRNEGYDTGDVAWMLFATTFVMLQTPATGFAQGGLVRRKNTMSVIGQSIMGVVIGCILWYVIGYSLTFGPTAGNGFIGDGTHAFMMGVSAFECIEGQTIPALLFAAFQMTFALMVPVLVTGAWAEKFHFSAACLFMAIWPFLVYYPTAHWVWGGGWLYTAAEADGAAGVLDYAGGIVIHTSSGISSLVVALMLQKRRVYKTQVEETTSNLPLTMIGVTLVWVGWYSFNGGSGLRANGQAIGALFVTQISACFSAATFALLSYRDDGKVQITHVGSGALAGLAGITPASGFVMPWVGVPYGVIVGAASFYGGQYIKARLNLDDVLDVTSLQAIPGALGSIMVGLFATNHAVPCGDSHVSVNSLCGYGEATDVDDTTMGVFYGGNGKLLGWQIFAVFIMVVWAAVFTWVTMKIISLFVPLDVTPEMEDIGLDKSEHGEKAYDLEGPQDEVSAEIMTAKLCNAAKLNDVDQMKQLVKLGVHPNDGDVDGRRPLHIAAAAGALDAVRYLVDELGAQVNAADNWGNPPLRDAQRYHQGTVLAYLKSKGAVLNEDADDVGRLLAAAGKGDEATLLTLIHAGIDANSADYDGRSALHLAACGGHHKACALLIQNGADVLLKDRWGNLAIHDAKRYKYDEVVAVIQGKAGSDFNFDLPERGADSDAGETTTSTRELLAAAKEGDVAEIRRLEKKQVDLFACDYDGRTALHQAAANGHLKAVEFLMTKPGINVNVQDSMKNTPLVDAANGNHTEVIAFLKGHGATEMNDEVGSVLCRAGMEGKLGVFEAKLATGTDLNTADYDGRTALHLAAAFGQIAAIKMLLENGANPTVTDRWGGTPIEDAIRCNHDDAIVILQGGSGVAAVSEGAAPPSAAGSINDGRSRGAVSLV